MDGGGRGVYGGRECQTLGSLGDSQLCPCPPTYHSLLHHLLVGRDLLSIQQLVAGGVLWKTKALTLAGLGSAVRPSQSRSEAPAQTLYKKALEAGDGE